jgi:protein-disulfide isomerase
MFCIVAFIVLSILGIFSATNRQLARESLDCVFRRITLRPCTTGFDEKIKSKILGSVINRSEGLARFLNKNFEVLSWVFFILLLGSSIWSVRGLYLFYVSGSCNGLNQSAFCVFDPTGKNNQVSSLGSECPIRPIGSSNQLSLTGVDLSGFPVTNSASQKNIVFIGSYGCDYTRETYPVVKALADKNNASFTYLDYPTKETSDYLSKVGYCVFQQNQADYWKLNDFLFTADKLNLSNTIFIDSELTNLGLEATSIESCVNDPQTKTVVTKQLTQIAKTGFYGTPTVFIKDTALVGPKPYRVYAITLDGLFYWLK